MSESGVGARSSSAPVQSSKSISAGDAKAGPHDEAVATAHASSHNRRMILAGGACVMAIVALIALPGTSRIEAPIVADPAAGDAVVPIRTMPASAQENVVVTPIEEQVVVRPVVHATEKAAAASTSEAAPVAPRWAESSRADAPAVGEPIAAPPVGAHAVAKPEPAEAMAVPIPTVTITGCLEKRDDTFRLTDTEGDAPKSRNWKSGFLAKRPAAVELVDAASSLWLAAQVGQRVSATGTLDDRELHVRSVRRATGACD